MGGSYQHPSVLQVKYRIRAYLVGKNCELVGSNHNTDKENHDVNLSKVPFAGCHADQVQNDSTNTEDLESELLISAMFFSCEPDITEEGKENSSISLGDEETMLESCMASEGLRYVGGFLVRKFPQYGHLGESVTVHDKTWIGEISRFQSKLKTPSKYFFEKLQVMEKLFVCFHGKKTLKAGKNSIVTLSRLINKYVNLPSEVINYFVRCRFFFRMRILNREKQSYYKRCNKQIKQLRA